MLILKNHIKYFNYLSVIISVFVFNNISFAQIDNDSSIIPDNLPIEIKNKINELLKGKDEFDTIFGEMSTYSALSRPLITRAPDYVWRKIEIYKALEYKYKQILFDKVIIYENNRNALLKLANNHFKNIPLWINGFNLPDPFVKFVKNDTTSDISDNDLNKKSVDELLEELERIKIKEEKDINIK